MKIDAKGLALAFFNNVTPLETLDPSSAGSVTNLPTAELQPSDPDANTTVQPESLGLPSSLRPETLTLPSREDKKRSIVLITAKEPTPGQTLQPVPITTQESKSLAPSLAPIGGTALSATLRLGKEAATRTRRLSPPEENVPGTQATEIVRRQYQLIETNRDLVRKMEAFATSVLSSRDAILNNADGDFKGTDIMAAHVIKGQAELLKVQESVGGEIAEGVKTGIVGRLEAAFKSCTKNLAGAARYADFVLSCDDALQMTMEQVERIKAELKTVDAAMTDFYDGDDGVYGLDRELSALEQNLANLESAAEKAAETGTKEAAYASGIVQRLQRAPNTVAAQEEESLVPAWSKAGELNASIVRVNLEIISARKKHKAASSKLPDRTASYNAFFVQVRDGNNKYKALHDEAVGILNRMHNAALAQYAMDAYKEQAELPADGLLTLTKLSERISQAKAKPSSTNSVSTRLLSLKT